MKKVTLRQELDALNLYLGIEQLRFGDRLRLEFDVETACEALVPSLVLQPLVENRSNTPSRRAKRAAGCASRRAKSRAGCGSRCRTTDPACRWALNSRRSWRRFPQHARAARGPVRRSAELAVRFSRPGLRLEITMPFERATQPT